MRKVRRVIAICVSAVCIILIGLLLVNCQMKKYYNKGNLYYEKANYLQSITYYDEALRWFPLKKQECDIRVNKALSIIGQIDFESADKEAIISQLEEAKAVLCEKGCAHEEDENGHDKEAQQLKDDIDAKLDELNKKEDEDSGDSDPQENTEQNTEDKKDDSNSENTENSEQESEDKEKESEQQTETQQMDDSEMQTETESESETSSTEEEDPDSIEAKLKKLQEENNKARQEENKNLDDLYSGYDYYDGDCW